MEFSEDIKKFLKDNYPNADIYSMSIDELKSFKEELIQKREEYTLLEMARKTLGNAAYGASANHTFYFYNMNVAADITAECRNLTKTMWDKLEHFFKYTIWERKDLWEKFDFELDESKRDSILNSNVSMYSDTDSVYTTYGPLFKCFTKESLKKYDTDDKKVRWILKFNQEFLDKQNTEWCEEMYGPRHGHNVHNFELENINRSQCVLSKKKYVKAIAFNKGKFFDNPKISGTGVEIIKSTTPKLCRTILTDLVKSIMNDMPTMEKGEFVLYFNDILSKYKKQFYNAPIEDISQSVGIGDYKKFVVDDNDALILEKGCPVSVQSIARFNYLAHKNNEDNKRLVSGKIKYYNIRTGMRAGDVGYFGYPAGEIPSWAPVMDYQTQWQKTIIDPINRFLEAVHIPLADASGTIQYNLFGLDF